MQAENPEEQNEVGAGPGRRKKKKSPRKIKRKKRYRNLTSKGGGVL